MGVRHARVRLRPVAIGTALLACVALVLSAAPMASPAQALVTSSIAPAMVIVSHPQMAAVLVDGVDGGLSTPATITSLRPGPHTLSLVIPGFDPWTTSVTMPATGKLNIVAGLKVTDDPADAVTVTVTTDSDAANGDTSSISALIANPGTDGVSLREAILAANNTTGSKVIKFAPALKGSTIAIGGPASTGGPAPNFLPQLLSGNASIIGDIDGDGLPDITLDGRLSNGDSLGWGITIWSSDNRVTGLRFLNFGGAILLSPGGDWPGPAKTLTDDQALGNSIVGNSGIYVGPLGLIGPANPVPISNLTWDQLVIAGNDIDQAPNGIFLYAGTASSHDNLISNVTIAANWIEGTAGGGGIDGIAVLAADGNSEFQRVPGPVLFADHNQLQNVTIERNHIDTMMKDGISVVAGNEGNSDNVVSDVHILNNQIRVLGPNLGPANGAGITLVANSESMDSGGRTASGNILRRVEVRGNKITNASVGIRLAAAENWGSQFPSLSALGPSVGNTAEDIVISHNTVSLGAGAIQPWSATGIIVVAALMGTAGTGPASYNLIKNVTISGNRLLDGKKRAVGIQVTAGFASLGDALVSHNTVMGLLISGNVLTGWKMAVLIAAGSAVQHRSTANSLTGKSVGNTIVSSTEGIRAVANYGNAWKNSIHFTRA